MRRLVAVVAASAALAASARAAPVSPVPPAVAAAAAAAEKPGAPVLPAAPHGAPAAAGQDPCVAARAPIPSDLEPLVAAARAEVDAYRTSWEAACDPTRGAADLAALLQEAEALVADVRTGRAVTALARAFPPDATWPLPGVLHLGAVLDVDWGTFAAFAPRGTAEDGRFFRGLARAARADGGPAWLGEAAPRDGAPCVRLGEISWADVALGIEEMERSDGEPYARRAALLRERLLATLGAIGGGGPVCGCVRGDPLPALDAVAAAPPRLGTPARRALVAAARAAADALRSGRARPSWLRDAPGAPPTGCGPGSR